MSTSVIEYLRSEMQAIRHHLHQNPELAFEEHGTSDLVAARLTGWGYDVVRGIGQTGLVATLRCGNGTRRLGLRADMDALPIHEETGLSYASRTSGVMHACGHDGHTAMLLGAAQHLARIRNFSGMLHLIFQPAEEKGFDSGAKAMVEDGLFERFPCDRIYAIHNHPGAPQGTFLFREGAFLSAGNTVHITVTGVGGHAARPHLAVDPVLVGSALVMALQSIVARNINPDDAAVVTVGKFVAGHAANVIPSTAELSLSVRSFDAEVRQKLRERITSLAMLTAESYGARANVNWIEGYPVVYNSPDELRLAEQVARDLVGDTRVVSPTPRIMGSEDFAYMLSQCPGALIRLGNGPASDGRSLHNACYDFNDENLVIGAAFWSRLVESYLKD